jgi:protein-S-isoprenylcysteine O-methyltransferase Ste14
MSTFLARYTLPIIVLLFFSLAVQGDLFFLNPLVIAVQFAGFLLIVSARLSFARQKFNLTAAPADGPLLQRGPYRFIRHPMYAGAMLIFLATVLGHPSTFSGAIGIVAFTLMLGRIVVEERLLRSRYTDFSEYARRTRRIIPFVY